MVMLQAGAEISGHNRTFSAQELYIGNHGSICSSCGGLIQDRCQLPQDGAQLPQDVTQLPQDVTQLPQDVTQLPQDVTHYKCLCPEAGAPAGGILFWTPHLLKI